MSTDAHTMIEELVREMRHFCNSVVTEEDLYQTGWMVHAELSRTGSVDKGIMRARMLSSLEGVDY